MRYGAEHKAEIHQKIVKDASRRVRAKGITGAAVAAVMQDAGLTHGGFYKHFGSKDELLLESLHQGFREMGDVLAEAAKSSRPKVAWKAIVKRYLSPEHCDHAERGCPLAALAPELSADRQGDERCDRRGVDRIQKSNASLDAGPTGGRQRARVFCDLFDDDWGSCDCTDIARSGGT